MYFKNILVPFDGSKHSHRAFEKALELTKKSDAKIKIITCIFVGYGSNVSYETKFVDLEEKRQRKGAFSQITKLERIAKKSGVSATGTVVKTFSIAEKIVNYAKSKKFDLIVMGSHGRTGFTRMIMGSITNGVLNNANCPVLIVK